ncbi:MAG TPA: hypothetical protein VGM94_01190 [Galbitalea sp.]
MTDYQDHVELRRLRQGRLVTGIMAFWTAFAFVWGDTLITAIALASQAVIWGTWAFIIQGDIRLLKRRAEYDEGRATRLRHLRNDVIPARHTRGKP